MLKEITKRRSLMGLIYGLVMLIPFCSVLVRCVYVQFNKNAYESYYGETINESKQVYTENLKTDQDYTLINNNNLVQGSNLSSINIKMGSLSGEFTNSTASDVTNLLNHIDEIYAFRVLYSSETSWTLRFFYDNGQANVYYSYVINISFQVSSNQTATQYKNNIYYLEYNKYSYLDNAFDYSLYSIVNNNNFGKLNLINWFTGVFLDANNSTNMLYLHFVNWYMNYALLVSCVYLLFLVLMWFVNLAQRLLTRFEVDRR